MRLWDHKVRDLHTPRAVVMSNAPAAHRSRNGRRSRRCPDSSPRRAPRRRLRRAPRSSWTSAPASESGTGSAPRIARRLPRRPNLLRSGHARARPAGGRRALRDALTVAALVSVPAVDALVELPVAVVGEAPGVRACAYLESAITSEVISSMVEKSGRDKSERPREMRDSAQR